MKEESYSRWGMFCVLGVIGFIVGLIDPLSIIHELGHCLAATLSGKQAYIENAHTTVIRGELNDFILVSGYAFEFLFWVACTIVLYLPKRRWAGAGFSLGYLLPIIFAPLSGTDLQSTTCPETYFVLWFFFILLVIMVLFVWMAEYHACTHKLIPPRGARRGQDSI